MSKIIKNDIAFQCEGLSMDVVEFKLTDKDLVNIDKAKKIVKENEFIDSISVGVHDINLKQFDDEDKELGRDDLNYNQCDTIFLLVSEYGVTLRGYNKWDSSYYFEVDV